MADSPSGVAWGDDRRPRRVPSPSSGSTVACRTFGIHHWLKSPRMTRTLVAGIDLTAMGRRVADRARIIAEQGDSTVNLVHVLEPVGEAMIDPRLARLMREHQTAEAQK